MHVLSSLIKLEGVPEKLKKESTNFKKRCQYFTRMCKKNLSMYT